MADTNLDIVNSALIKLGEPRISSLDDEGKAPESAKQIFDDLRKAVLRAHPWNFAIKRVALGTLAADPAFEWTYAYQLPSDCLKVLDTNEGDIEWKIEGRTLLANYSGLKIKYIADITDPTQFDPLFEQALSYRLAMDLSYALTQSKSMFELMNAGYIAQLREARSVDAQEGSPDSVDASEWLNARL